MELDLSVKYRKDFCIPVLNSDNVCNFDTRERLIQWNVIDGAHRSFGVISWRVLEIRLAKIARLLYRSLECQAI